MGETQEETEGNKSEKQAEKPIRSILTSTGIGVGMILMMLIWSVIMIGITYITLGEITVQTEVVTQTIGLAFGAATITIIYYKYIQPGDDFIENKGISLNALLLIAGGIIGLLISAFAIELLSNILNLPRGDHGIYELALGEEQQVSEGIILLMIPLQILLVGPAEEIVFRGIIQNHLALTFSEKGAIGITSIIFALVHIPAYFTTNIIELSLALTSILLLSIIIGSIYAYTKNIIIPILIHGIYNAILFGLLFLEMSNTVTLS